jgi:DNA-binding MarR family transcriptional regulator
MMPHLHLRDNWVEMGGDARYTRAYVVVSTISLKWIKQGRTMLDVFITSRVRRKIIVIYAKYPDFKTHVRGLAKLIKEDAGNIQRELKRLEKAGFLISEKQGNTKIYHTNKQFVIFKELQSIVLKSQRTSQRRNVA